MCDEGISEEDAKLCRERVKYEDKLLNARTSIVVAINGLGAIAVGMATLGNPVRMYIAIVIIIINILWACCSREAQGYIKFLTKKIKTAQKPPYTERLRKEFLGKKKEFLGKKRRMAPTKFFGTVMPFLLLAAWIIGVLLVIVLKYTALD